MNLDQPLESPTETIRPKRRTVRQMLYSQNPFYLLSVCFVLHGSGIWYRANSHSHSPWILSGIIAAYIFMMAGAGFSIVKWGKVWDDARSILLILLALFLELGMTADDVIIGDRAMGQIMALAAWLFSAAVSEFILIGLGIRLRTLYRIPFHLLLAVILLYPIVIVQGEYLHDAAQNNLTIFLFSPIVAAILLSLVPAIRQGASYVKDNGTPWAWPLFPWSLFVFLTAIAVFRLYALCLSFDPVLDVSWSAALELQNSFSGVYLVPILLAVSVLCLEGYLSTDSQGARRVGLMLPFLAILLAAPEIVKSGDVTLSGRFIEQVTTDFASPVWITTLASCSILFYAMFHRVKSSDIALSASLVLFAFLSPKESDFRSLGDAASFPILIAAAIQVFAGWQRRSSLQVFGGLLCLVVVGLTLLRIEDRFSQILVTWYLTLAAVLVVGLSMNDLFAFAMRSLGGLMLITCCGLPAILAWYGYWDLTVFPMTMHVLGATAISLILSWRTRERSFQAAAFVGCSATVISGSVRLVRFLISHPGGKGILWAVGGLLWFAMAAVISARKAGLRIGVPTWLRHRHADPGSSD
jgi:intracellular septation protein A